MGRCPWAGMYVCIYLYIIGVPVSWARSSAVPGAVVRFLQNDKLPVVIIMLIRGKHIPVVIYNKKIIIAMQIKPASS